MNQSQAAVGMIDIPISDDGKTLTHGGLLCDQQTTVAEKFDLRSCDTQQTDFGDSALQPAVD